MKHTLVVGITMFAAALPMLSEEKFPQSFEITTTERVKFTPGGTLHLNDSYGYLSIEGWDESEAEITITKSTDRYYRPDQENEAKKKLDQIRVEIKHPSDTDLEITTTRAPRHGTWAPPLPEKTMAGITVDYQIHVPRNSHLMIHHDKGYVWVADITGEIEAESHSGDMTLMLPVPAVYSIDAKSRMGSVTSDFVGQGASEFAVGTRFIREGEGQSRRVYLRIGRGSITIKQSPALTPAERN